MSKRQRKWPNERRLLAFTLIAFFALLFISSCKPPTGTVTTPPMPEFVPNSTPSDAVDQGIFADYGTQNGIVIQWEPDSTANTSGYVLYRSAGDSSVGTDGLLRNRTTIATLESNNFPLTTPQTYFDDTIAITPGARYYYQLQGFYRETDNSITNGPATHPGLATSFHFVQRVVLESPIGLDNLHGNQLPFMWEDPNLGGTYQIIVQRLDDQEYVWSHIASGDANPIVETYSSTATPLLANVPYQWRVKWIEANGGSSSVWSAFSIQP